MGEAVRRLRGAAAGPGRLVRVGRPRVIQSAEEMDRRVDDYVTRCHTDDEPLTLTGLCLGLGLSGRQSLAEYEARPDFSDPVKRARLLVEHEYEGG